MSLPAELRQRLTPDFVSSLDPNVQEEVLELIEASRTLEAKEEQSQLGWYDTEGVRQGGLVGGLRQDHVGGRAAAAG